MSDGETAGRGLSAWVLSDLHMTIREALDLRAMGRIPAADVCVLAGDVCDSMHAAVNWVGKVIGSVMPVVYVAGNHEFYDTSIATGRSDARTIARALGVHLLDNSSATIGGVRFVGGTLWTDYALHAGGLEGDGRRKEVAWAMSEAANGIADHANVDWSGVGAGGIIPRKFKPRDALSLHAETRSYIEGALAEAHDGPTVVVTHHAPHPGSVSPQYEGNRLTPAFVSDLSAVIDRGQPDAWVHGHVHQSFDYRVGRTRVVCNPRGYHVENESSFRWGKVIRIGRDG